MANAHTPMKKTAAPVFFIKVLLLNKKTRRLAKLLRPVPALCGQFDFSPTHPPGTTVIVEPMEEFLSTTSDHNILF
jgi:hypothetical protein